MLGSVVVALITVSLISVGVYLGNIQDKTTETGETNSYEENFFSSLDVLVGGLEESAERGEKTRIDRYQEYLKTQEQIAETEEQVEITPETVFAEPTAERPERVSVPAPKVNETPATDQKVLAVPSLPQVVPIPAPQPKPEPKPKPKPIPQPSVPPIPPPSSIGADDLSTRLDDFLSGFDFGDDSFDEAIFDEELAE